MKNRIFAVLLAGALAAGMCACGSSAGENQETEEAGTEVIEVDPFVYDTPASSTFSYTAAEQVTFLPDYSPVAITLSSGYEINDTNLERTMQQTLAYYGFDAVVDTEKDVVEANDWVRVDYTGYLNGEAFEGGAAADQIINVADNCSLSGSGFIPGFTDALAGAKVGEEISGKVTFPENYGSELLAGQEAEFVFQVHSVVEIVTFDTLNDKMVAEGIGTSFGFQTVAEFKAALQNMMERNLAEAKNNAIQDYFLKNSTVEIPEDFLEARLNEDLYMMAKNYCSQGQTFEEYLAANNTSLDQILPDIRKSSEETIKLEWIFSLIAEKDGYELDEDTFRSGVDSLIAGNANFENETDLYNFYGCNDAAYGEQFMRMQYLISNVIADLAQKAEITFE